MKQTVQYKNGYSLSFSEYGDQNGYPILVEHGLIASIEDGHLFERLIRLGAHLICIARPGYGESSPYILNQFAEWADIVAVLIEELKLSRFDILGISSGAPYSYAVGSRFPDKVRNIYIFSGIPALYDENVLSYWPYEVKKDASTGELKKLAHELFFSNLSEEDLKKNDIEDSMRNDCFGIAQDLRLRFVGWGFTLSDVKENVYMEHSRDDTNVPLITAAITARLLPQCNFKVRENGGHFSSEALDHFIQNVMVGYSKY